MNRLITVWNRIVSKFHGTTWWYGLIYFFGKTYSSTLHLLPRKQAVINQNPRKIIIIYSKFHFDPEKDSPTRPLAFNSAANLARNIYKVAEGAEVIYRDQHEPILDITDADIVFGILSSAFLKYCAQNLKAEKILFLVNCHPLFRLRTLRNEALLNEVSIPSKDYVSPFRAIRCLRAADTLVLIGNKTVKQTFFDYGTFGKNIRLINSGVNADTLTPAENRLRDGKIRILYAATDLGIRKGIFRLMKVWEKISKSIPNAELVLLGQNHDYPEEVDAFRKRYSNIVFHGWVDSTSEKYREILQGADIVLGLSLEEGQVGTILEAMSTGVIPVITRECGVPVTSGSGFLLESFDEDTIVSIVEDLARAEEKRETMRLSARKYILEHHTWDLFNKKIKEIIFN